MQGMPTPKQLTPEQIAAVIPPEIKRIRELTLGLMGIELFKEWHRAMKDYYIMKTPVAIASYGAPYVRFREGQNSLLRAIDSFAMEEEDYNKMISEQLLSGNTGAMQ